MARLIKWWISFHNEILDYVLYDLFHDLSNVVRTGNFQSNTGYILVSANGGLNQQRVAVSKMFSNTLLTILIIFMHMIEGFMEFII